MTYYCFFFFFFHVHTKISECLVMKTGLKSWNPEYVFYFIMSKGGNMCSLHPPLSNHIFQMWKDLSWEKCWFSHLNQLSQCAQNNRLNKLQWVLCRLFKNKSYCCFFFFFFFFFLVCLFFLFACLWDLQFYNIELGCFATLLELSTQHHNTRQKNNSTPILVFFTLLYLPVSSPVPYAWSSQ